MAYWEYCFPRYSLYTNHGILGVLFSNMPWFVNREHLGKQYSQYAMVCELGAFWKTVLLICHCLWLYTTKCRFIQEKIPHGKNAEKTNISIEWRVH